MGGILRIDRLHRVQLQRARLQNHGHQPFLISSRSTGGIARDGPVGGSCSLCADASVRTAESALEIGCVTSRAELFGSALFSLTAKCHSCAALASAETPYTLHVVIPAISRHRS